MALDVNPLQEIELVSVNDPAIRRDSDADEDALDRYIETRDMSALEWVDGATPMVWRFKALGIKGRAYAELADKIPIKHIRAFQWAFVSVSGLTVRGHDWEPRFEKKKDGKGPLREESLDELEMAGLGAIVNELGGVCLQRAYLDPFGGESYSLPLRCMVVSARKSTATAPAGTKTSDANSTSATAAPEKPTS